MSVTMMAEGVQVGDGETAALHEGLGALRNQLMGLLDVVDALDAEVMVMDAVARVRDRL